MFPTTPKAVDAVLSEFCRSVVADAVPEFVPVRPEGFAEYGYCHLNVREKVARDGGSCSAGWLIWLASDVFIEAEFHSVWRSPGGELIDVTPKPDGERRVLFVPDAGRVWDGGPPPPNLFRPLSDSPLASMLQSMKDLDDRKRSRNWNSPQAIAKRRAAEARITGSSLPPEPKLRTEKIKKSLKKRRRQERRQKRNGRR